MWVCAWVCVHVCPSVDSESFSFWIKILHPSICLVLDWFWTTEEPPGGPVCWQRSSSLTRHPSPLLHVMTAPRGSSSTDSNSQRNSGTFLCSFNTWRNKATGTEQEPSSELQENLLKDSGSMFPPGESLLVRTNRRNQPSLPTSSQ